MGIVLYVPAKALASLTEVPFAVTSALTGIICISYCSTGGYRSIIWTDVAQTILMFLCFGLIIGQELFYSENGLADAVVESYRGGRLEINFIEKLGSHYSLWSLAAYGLFQGVQRFSVGQVGAQRLMSIKTLRDSKTSLHISCAMVVIFKVLLVLSGCVIYNELKNCDPRRNPASGVKSSDQILGYAVGRSLSRWPGFTGLAYCGILAGSLSSFSSFINSFAALTVEDFVKPYFRNISFSESNYVRICKICTAIYGGIAIVISFGIPYLPEAKKILTYLLPSVFGPFCAVMLLGMLQPRSNTKVCIISLTFGLSIMMLLSIGSLISPKLYEKLPTSISDCSNGTTSHFHFPHNISRHSAEFTVDIEHDYRNDFPIGSISVMWISPIGFSFTFLMGWALSFLLGHKEIVIDASLLSPSVASAFNLNRNDTINLDEIKKLASADS